MADFYAGRGGPARYLAHKYGAVVTCIELNPDRAPGPWDLTRRVGLTSRVRVVRGDVMRVPLAGDSMDAVIQSFERYRLLQEQAGFRDIGIEDVTGVGGEILAQRFAMYGKLRGNDPRRSAVR